MRASCMVRLILKHSSAKDLLSPFDRSGRSRFEKNEIEDIGMVGGLKAAARPYRTCGT